MRTVSVSTVQPSPVRVLVLTRYARKGASSRIRHLDLIAKLHDFGFRCDVHHLMDDDAVTRFYTNLPRQKGSLARSYLERVRLLLTKPRAYDLIWIEKEAFPWLPWSVERLAYCRAACATVVDFDDYWPERYSEHRFSIVRRFGSKFARLVSAADAVTAANPLLAGSIEALGGCSAEVIYNAIDLDRYARAGNAARCAAGPMRVGWIGTPYTAGKHLVRVTPILNRLQAEGIIEVVLVGAGEAAAQLRARRLPWSEECEAEVIATFDVGIMPLGDSRFDAGKSAWKLVQCMAAGRTVVASEVGFNAKLVEDGVTGFLASDAEGFERRLRQLAANPDLRVSMGRAAQAGLSRWYGLEPTVAGTVDVFRRALAAAQSRTCG